MVAVCYGSVGVVEELMSAGIRYRERTKIPIDGAVRNLKAVDTYSQFKKLFY